MKAILATILIFTVAFLDNGNSRMTRMTRSDPTEPGLEEVGELFIEKGKRMGDFGFRERTRPRLGKRVYETGMF